MASVAKTESNPPQNCKQCKVTKEKIDRKEKVIKLLKEYITTKGQKGQFKDPLPPHQINLLRSQALEDSARLQRELSELVKCTKLDLQKHTATRKNLDELRSALHEKDATLNLLAFQQKQLGAAVKEKDEKIKALEETVKVLTSKSESCVCGTSIPLKKKRKPKESPPDSGSALSTSENPLSVRSAISEYPQSVGSSFTGFPHAGQSSGPSYVLTPASSTSSSDRVAENVPSPGVPWDSISCVGSPLQDNESQSSSASQSEVDSESQNKFCGIFQSSCASDEAPAKDECNLENGGIFPNISGEDCATRQLDLADGSGLPTLCTNNDADLSPGDLFQAETLPTPSTSTSPAGQTNVVSPVMQSVFDIPSIDVLADNKTDSVEDKNDTPQKTNPVGSIFFDYSVDDRHIDEEESNANECIVPPTSANATLKKLDHPIEVKVSQEDESAKIGISTTSPKKVIPLARFLETISAHSREQSKKSTLFPEPEPLTASPELESSLVLPSPSVPEPELDRRVETPIPPIDTRDSDSDESRGFSSPGLRALLNSEGLKKMVSPMKSLHSSPARTSPLKLSPKSRKATFGSPRSRRGCQSPKKKMSTPQKTKLEVEQVHDSPYKTLGLELSDDSDSDDSMMLDDVSLSVGSPKKSAPHERSPTKPTPTKSPILKGSAHIGEESSIVDVELENPCMPARSHSLTRFQIPSKPSIAESSNVEEVEPLVSNTRSEVGIDSTVPCCSTVLATEPSECLLPSESGEEVVFVNGKPSHLELSESAHDKGKLLCNELQHGLEEKPLHNVNEQITVSTANLNAKLSSIQENSQEESSRMETVDSAIRVESPDFHGFEGCTSGSNLFIAWHQRVGRLPTTTTLSCVPPIFVDKVSKGGIFTQPKVQLLTSSVSSECVPFNLSDSLSFSDLNKEELSLGGNNTNVFSGLKNASPSSTGWRNSPNSLWDPIEPLCQSLHSLSLSTPNPFCELHKGNDRRPLSRAGVFSDQAIFASHRTCCHNIMAFQSPKYCFQATGRNTFISPKLVGIKQEDSPVALLVHKAVLNPHNALLNYFSPASSLEPQNSPPSDYIDLRCRSDCQGVHCCQKIPSHFDCPSNHSLPLCSRPFAWTNNKNTVFKAESSSPSSSGCTHKPAILNPITTWRETRNHQLSPANVFLQKASIVNNKQTERATFSYDADHVPSRIRSAGSLLQSTFTGTFPPPKFQPTTPHYHNDPKGPRVHNQPLLQAVPRDGVAASPNSIKGNVSKPISPKETACTGERVNQPDQVHLSVPNDVAPPVENVVTANSKSIETETMSGVVNHSEKIVTHNRKPVKFYHTMESAMALTKKKYRNSLSPKKGSNCMAQKSQEMVSDRPVHSEKIDECTTNSFDMVHTHDESPSQEFTNMNSLANIPISFLTESSGRTPSNGPSSSPKCSSNSRLSDGPVVQDSLTDREVGTCYSEITVSPESRTNVFDSNPMLLSVVGSSNLSPLKPSILTVDVAHEISNNCSSLVSKKENILETPPNRDETCIDRMTSIYSDSLSSLESTCLNSVEDEVPEVSHEMDYSTQVQTSSSSANTPNDDEAWIPELTLKKKRVAHSPKSEVSSPTKDLQSRTSLRGRNCSVEFKLPQIPSSPKKNHSSPTSKSEGRGKLLKSARSPQVQKKTSLQKADQPSLLPDTAVTFKVPTGVGIKPCSKCKFTQDLCSCLVEGIIKEYFIVNPLSPFPLSPARFESNEEQVTLSDFGMADGGNSVVESQVAVLDSCILSADTISAEATETQPSVPLIDKDETTYAVTRTRIEGIDHSCHEIDSNLESKIVDDAVSIEVNGPALEDEGIKQSRVIDDSIKSQVEDTLVSIASKSTDERTKRTRKSSSTSDTSIEDIEPVPKRRRSSLRNKNSSSEHRVLRSRQIPLELQTTKSKSAPKRRSVRTNINQKKVEPNVLSRPVLRRKNPEGTSPLSTMRTPCSKEDVESNPAKLLLSLEKPGKTVKMNQTGSHCSENIGGDTNDVLCSSEKPTVIQVPRDSAISMPRSQYVPDELVVNRLEGHPKITLGHTTERAISDSTARSSKIPNDTSPSGEPTLSGWMSLKNTLVEEAKNVKRSPSRSPTKQKVQEGSPRKTKLLDIPGRLPGDPMRSELSPPLHRIPVQNGRALIASPDRSSPQEFHSNESKSSHGISNGVLSSGEETSVTEPCESRLPLSHNATNLPASPVVPVVDMEQAESLVSENIKAECQKLASVNSRRSQITSISAKRVYSLANQANVLSHIGQFFGNRGVQLEEETSRVTPNQEAACDEMPNGPSVNPVPDAQVALYCNSPNAGAKTDSEVDSDQEMVIDDNAYPEHCRSPRPVELTPNQNSSYSIFGFYNQKPNSHVEKCSSPSFEKAMDVSSVSDSNSCLSSLPQVSGFYTSSKSETMEDSTPAETPSTSKIPQTPQFSGFYCDEPASPSPSSNPQRTINLMNFPKDLEATCIPIPDDELVPCCINIIGLAEHYILPKGREIRTIKPFIEPKADMELKISNQLNRYFQNSDGEHSLMYLKRFLRTQQVLPTQLAKVLCEIVAKSKVKSKVAKEEAKGCLSYLTVTQKKAATLLIELGTGNLDYFDKVLTVMEQFLSTNPTDRNEHLEKNGYGSIASLYGLLCRTQNFKLRAQSFIFDLIYGRHLSYFKIILNILYMLPDVMPYASDPNNGPLTYTIAYILMKQGIYKQIREDELAMFGVFALRSKLTHQLGYSFSPDLTRDHVMEGLINNIMTKGCDKAIVLLCKNQGFKWTHGVALLHIFPFLQKFIDGQEEDTFKVFRYITVLGEISRGFARSIGAQFVKKSLDLLEEVLSLKPGPMVAEAVISALVHFRRLDPPRVMKILSSWTPSEGKVSLGTIVAVKRMDAGKSHYWKSLTTSVT